MIASNSSMAIWNDYLLQSIDMNIGCVSRTGHTKLLGGLYFIHYSGIFATNGEAPKLISSKVETYIRGATKANLEAAVMGHKGRSVFCWIGDSTLYNPDGSVQDTLKDVVLEYNVTQEDWYVHTNVKATHFETYIESTNTDRLVMTTSDTNCPVLEFLSGESDNGNEIFMRADTSDLPLVGTFEKFFYPQEVLIDVGRGSNIQVFVSLDHGPFYELEGTASKGSTILKVTNKDGSRGKPPRCREIKISLRHSAKQIVRINRLAVTFNPTAEEEPQAAQNDGS